MLGLTGTPLWQDEGYYHMVRHRGEFEKIRGYIERNPVRAGLVSEASEICRSSAAGSAADQGVGATKG
jgi:hypothetical protein